MQAGSIKGLRMMCSIEVMCCIGLMTATSVTASSTAEAAEAAAAAARLHWAVSIPMRDGVHLAGTLYTPKSQQTPTPCILTMTPYIADRYHEDGMYFASRGLAFISVDTRGRGNSQGSFRPMIQEANDGYDTVEWLARQPYCNGKVAMWGYSYGGYAQWAAAKELPPHLVSMAPAASHYSGFDWPLRNNVFSHCISWLAGVSGTTPQDRLIRDKGFWDDTNQQWLRSGTAFKDLDTLAGMPSAVFREWVSHPEADAYWDAQAPTPQQYKQLTLPILTITGAYDGLQLGALAYYKQHMRYGNDDAKSRHYLVIGPWDHGGTYKPRAEFNGMKFGPASLVDLPKLHRDWYDWTMQNGPKPEFLAKRVAYYVIGTEAWRYADSLDAVTAQSTPYYLQSTANPVDVFHAGSLGKNAPSTGRADHYTYDPKDVSSVELHSNADSASQPDQRLIYASNGDQLIYHTAVFDRDTLIAGFFELQAWLSIDQADTDFLVSIYQINPDGSSVRITDDLMRARYREGLREPQLIRTRQPLRYDFNHFGFVARQLTKGSRLRLVISPTDHYPEIYWEKNYNSGNVVAEETLKDAHTVTVGIYHDKAHPSALYVPFGRLSQ